MNSLPLNALLEFVDECDLSDASQQDCAPTRKGPSSSTPKQQSRNVREIASLQAQVASLTQQLKQVKETRSAGANLGLDQGSYWQDEAELQSRQRFAAQEENERLRDQLQALKQVAMRLVNMMKRRPSIRIQQMLVNYELAARKRASKRDAEFDQAFFEADAVLASADLFEECSCLSDSQSHLQSGRQGISFQFRRCLLLQRDLAAVSDAMWRFRPHHELRKHFIYEQILDNSSGYTCRFKPKQSFNSSIEFRAKLRQRRYVSNGRVVIIWKYQAHDSTAFLQLWGRGYLIIEPGPAEPSGTTLLRSTVWVSPENSRPNMDEIQGDARFRVLMGYLNHAFESYAALTNELVLEPGTEELSLH